MIRKLDKKKVAKRVKPNKQIMMLYYDNAPSHNEFLTQSYLSTTSFKKVPHHPYLNVLALCDFGFLVLIKLTSKVVNLNQRTRFLKNSTTISKENRKTFKFNFFRNGKGLYIGALN